MQISPAKNRKFLRPAKKYTHYGMEKKKENKNASRAQNGNCSPKG